MMRPARTAAASLLAIASGCGTTKLDQTAGISKGSEEAIVVLAAPARSTVWLYEGTDDGVNRTCGSFLKPATRLSAQGGFVVARLPPRTGSAKYAIAEVARRPGANRGLRPSAKVKVPVFNAVPGQVTFVGGVNLLGVGDGLDLVPDPSATTDRATRYLAKRYPGVSGRVVKGKMNWVYLTDACTRL